MDLASSAVSCSNQCPPESPCQYSSGEFSRYCCMNIDAVTVSFPSASISRVEDAPQDSHLSHVKITDPKCGNSSSSSDLSSSSLQDVHIVKFFPFLFLSHLSFFSLTG